MSEAKTKTYRVAVVGATGQVGRPLTLNLLRNGHAVLAISRSRSRRTEVLEAAGAEVHIADTVDSEQKALDLATAIRNFKADVMVIATSASTQSVRNNGPWYLHAALQSTTVKRYVPTEFGVHTKALDYGVGVLFDAKKDLHQRIFDSGLEWTFIYPGGFFDYFLPNLRFWEQLTTYGDLNAEFPTHDIRDIGAIAALAVTDPRCANKCVQIYKNITTQAKLLDQIEKWWPGKRFEVLHHSSEEILRLRDEAKPGVSSAKAGNESDQERWGINHAIYTLGAFAAPSDPDTLLTTDLYPDFEYHTIESALKDPAFIFGV